MTVTLTLTLTVSDNRRSTGSVVDGGTARSFGGTLLGGTQVAQARQAGGPGRSMEPEKEKSDSSGNKNKMEIQNKTENTEQTS